MIQSDNTVAQAKNSIVTEFLAYLVSKGFFRTVTLNFLMVGHTHEDIDQLFGLMIQMACRKGHWQTPEELMSFLAKELESNFRNKGEEFFVERTAGVRAFCKWMQPLRCKIYNCFGNRDGVEAPHSFAFKLGQDLAPREAAMCTGVPESQGTYCCVKTYMRDLQLQQPPELLLGALDVERELATSEPTTVLPLHPLAAVAISGFLQLSALCKNQYDMPLAGAALHHLAVNRDVALPRDRWLDCAGRRPADVVDSGNIYFPHLPETSWRLLVKRG